MRVLFDHQVTSLQDAGGVSRYFYELARSFSNDDQLRPELLLGLTDSAMPFGKLRGSARVLSWPAKGLTAGYQRYATNEAMTAAVAPFRGRYDIYHATYQRALPWVRRRALVVTHHDSTPDRFPELFKDAATIHARLARLYDRADRILCISESSRNDLLEFYGVDETKTEVIYQGFTPLEAGGDGLQENLLPDPGSDLGGYPFVLYVGSRPAYKNFSLVLQALASQGNNALWLLAVGGGAFTVEEGSYIDRLGLRSRVRLLPRASDEQLAAAYRAAHLLVYPSLYEGFGFPPLEAMAAGCPALVSRTSALPEICGDAAFYFDPTRVEELISVIDQLMGSERLRTAKRAAGLEQVKRYSWEWTAAATLAAYEKALQAG